MRCDFVYPRERYLLLGTVGKPHGLKGEVYIAPLSGQPEQLGQYAGFTLVDGNGKLSPRLLLTSFRIHKGRGVCRFDRVVDRTLAEKLTGMGVLLAREDLPEPGQGEFYWHQLQGLPVGTIAGAQLGHLQGVFYNGAQDVMVIGGSGQEYLIPVVPGIIVSQNGSGLIIDPPPGLLTINTGEDDADRPEEAAGSKE